MKTPFDGLLQSLMRRFGRNSVFNHWASLGASSGAIKSRASSFFMPPYWVWDTFDGNLEITEHAPNVGAGWVYSFSANEVIGLADGGWDTSFGGHGMLTVLSDQVLTGNYATEVDFEVQANFEGMFKVALIVNEGTEPSSLSSVPSDMEYVSVTYNGVDATELVINIEGMESGNTAQRQLGPLMAGQHTLRAELRDDGSGHMSMYVTLDGDPATSISVNTDGTLSLYPKRANSYAGVACNLLGGTVKEYRCIKLPA